MDPFIANFLPNLAANLATQVIQYVAPKVKKQFVGSEKELALQRCFDAGIVAILTTAKSSSKDELHLLEDICTKFFQQDDVQYEIAGLLGSKSLNQLEMLQQFEKAGFDAKTLPGIDPKTAFILFENAFLEAAFQETELQELVQTGLIVRQTRIQQDLLNAVQDLIRFLKKSHREDLRLQNGKLISQEMVSGQPIFYQIPVVIGEPAAADWEMHYLKTLFTRCDELDLSPIDPGLVQTEKGTAEIPIRLSDVFTTLYLKNLTRTKDQSVTDALRKPTDEMRTGQKEEERLHIQAIEAVAATKRLVILGQPGAGKSTLVNHLTAQLARRRAGLEVKPEHLSGWQPDAKPIPVRIILRRLAAWLPASAPPDKTGLIWEYLEKSLGDAGCKECFISLKNKLIHEGGIIFFDGLDEVSETDAAAKRSLIKKAIEQFATAMDNCRIILTCREYAYKAGAAWRLSEAVFPIVELNLFNLEQIEQFTKTWYLVTGPAKGWDETKCQNEANQLYLAVKEWPHLFELAQSPLLLTLMSQVHGRYGYLPKDRADLYARTVELMLAHWENRIARDLGSEHKVEKDLIYQLNIRTDTLLATLQEVAFRAHERQEKEKNRGEGAADIQKAELREILGHALKSYDQAEIVIQYTQERAGLLQARDNFTYLSRTARFRNIWPRAIC
ncbi:NACHT domain-containing protein [candidate division KSB1 bacterium]|nr:NACHT domain-containing protein [candidate division KSB1 bacterium]